MNGEAMPGADEETERKVFVKGQVRSPLSFERETEEPANAWRNVGISKVTVNIIVTFSRKKTRSSTHRVSSLGHCWHLV